MHTAKFDKSKARPTPNPQFFEGSVSMQELVPASESEEITVTAVFFENGARTRPHVHDADQVLAVVEGTCVVADEHSKHELQSGEYAHVAAGQWHWHGAAPGNSACHLSIRKVSNTEWDVPTRDW